MSREETKKMNETQIFKVSPVDKQLRTEVSIITNNSNDMYPMPTSAASAQNHYHDPNVILSETSKLSHSPTRVHVIHKPTVSDTSRVYNPYPVKNEYDRYVKSGGFLFEPIHHAETNGTHSETAISKAELRRQSTSLITKPNIKNANIAFSSESISPYTRRDSFRQGQQLTYKNPVDNDQLLNISRGYVNTHLKKETEFQNFNQLKTFNEHDRNLDQLQQQQQHESSLETNNKQQPHPLNYKNTPPAKIKLSESELSNKILIKKPDQTNLNLINSINNELRKFQQTGYQPGYQSGHDTSNN